MPIRVNCHPLKKRPAVLRQCLGQLSGSRFGQSRQPLVLCQTVIVQSMRLEGIWVLFFYVIRFSYFQLIVMTVFESKCFFYKLDNLVLIFLIGFLFSCWPMRSHNKPYFGDFFDNFFDNLLDDFLRNFLTYNLLTVASFRIGVPSIMFLLNESGVAFSVAC